MRARAVCWAASAFLLTRAAAGADVAIVDAGFEDPYLGGNLPAEYAGDVPAGAFPTGDPPAGWTAWYEGGSPIAGAFIGVLNPGTAADHAPNPAYFPAGAPEGDNAVLLYMSGDTGANEYGVEQELSATLEANTVYTLTVQVGNIASGTALVEPYLGFGYFDLRGFPGYRIQLLAGGELIAEDTGSILPDEGVFQLATAQATTGGTHDQLGEPLVVRVVSRNEPDVAGVTGIEVDFDDVRLDASPASSSLPVSPAAGALLAVVLLTAGRRLAP